jgi:uncharacterized protein
MRRTIPGMRRTLSLSAFIVIFIGRSFAQEPTPERIIDMHLHAFPTDPSSTICAPVQYFPPWDAKDIPDYNSIQSFPCAKPLRPPKTDDELMNRTLDILRKLNITAVTNGMPDIIDRWKKAGGKRILPATDFNGQKPRLTDLRTWVKAGRVVAFAEVGTQYSGIAINSPVLEPYFALAEELDVPVGIHMGPGPPGAPYLSGMQPYRAQLSSLLLLEDVLVRHPKLRIWAMHAGWPFGDDAIATLYTHPQLYVDVGIIDYFLPRAEFGKRIMFGSDQMIWPDAISAAVESIRSAPFLSETQKRDILYNNAATFLRITDGDQPMPSH